MGRGLRTARKALSYLASKKDASGTWGTTQATIMALRALLLSHGEGHGRCARHGGGIAEWQGGEKLELTPENNDLLHQFVFKGIDAQRTNTSN